MLEGEKNASEKESFMAWFLGQCIEAGEINAEIKTRNDEDYMEGLGYLKKVQKQTYRLTTKSKGLLFAHYGV